MKKQKKRVYLTNTSVLLVAVLITIHEIHAQKMALVAENQKSREEVPLIMGETLSYKSFSAAYFVASTVEGFTDSTISFSNKKTGAITLRHKEIVALKFHRSKERNGVGTFLVVIGGLGTLIGVVSAASPPSGFDASGVSSGMHTAGLIIGAVGLPLLVGGIAVKCGRKIDLEKTWKLKVVHFN